IARMPAVDRRGAQGRGSLNLRDKMAEGPRVQSLRLAHDRLRCRILQRVCLSEVMPSGKQATLIVWFVGMSVLIGLTLWYGADHVGAAMVSAGWATAAVVVARLAAVAIAGGGWWLLFPRR